MTTIKFCTLIACVALTIWHVGLVTAKDSGEKEDVQKVIAEAPRGDVTPADVPKDGTSESEITEEPAEEPEEDEEKAKAEGKHRDSSCLQSYLGVKYTLKSCDAGFNGVLKAFGVGFAKRCIAERLSPIHQLQSPTEGIYDFVVTNFGFGEFHIKFELNKEFNYETIDGRKVTSIITQENNTLTDNQRWVDKKKRNRTAVISHVLEDKKVTTTITVDDQKTVCIYEAK